MTAPPVPLFHDPFVFDIDTNHTRTAHGQINRNDRILIKNQSTMLDLFSLPIIIFKINLL